MTLYNQIKQLQIDKECIEDDFLMLSDKLKDASLKLKASESEILKEKSQLIETKSSLETQLSELNKQFEIDKKGLEDKCFKLSDQLKAASREFETSESEKSELLKEQSQLIEAKSSLETQLSELNKHKQCIENDYSKLSEQLKAVSRKFEASESEKLKLLKEKTQLIEAKSSLKKQLSELNEQVKDTSRKFETSESEKLELLEEKFQLVETKSRLEKQLSELNEQVKDTSRKFETSESEKLELLEEKFQLIETKSRLEKQLSELNKQVKDTSRKFETSESEKLELLEEKFQLVETKSRLEKQLSELDEQVKDTFRKFEISESEKLELLKEQSQLIETKSRLEKQLSEIDEQVKYTSRKFETSESEKLELLEEKYELIETKGSLEAQLSELNKHKQCIENDYSKLSEQLKAVSRKFEASESEKLKLLKGKTQLVEAKSSLETQLSELNEQVKDTSRKFETSESEKLELLEEKSQLLETKGRLEKQLSEFNEQIKDTSRKFETSESEKSELLKEQSQLIEAKSKLEKQLSELDEQLKIKLLEQKKLLNLVADQQNKIENLSSEVNRLDSEKKSTSNEASDLRESLKKAHATISEAKDLYTKELAEEQAKLRNAIEQKDIECTELQCQVSEEKRQQSERVEALEKRIHELTEECKKDKACIHTLRNDMEKEAIKAEKELKNLQEELLDQRINLKGTDEKLKAEKQLTADHLKQIEQLEERWQLLDESYQDQLRESRSREKETSRKYSDERQKISDELNEKSKALEKVIEKNLELTQQKEGMAENLLAKDTTMQRLYDKIFQLETLLNKANSQLLRQPHYQDKGLHLQRAINDVEMDVVVLPDSTIEPQSPDSTETRPNSPISTDASYHPSESTPISRSEIPRTEIESGNDANSVPEEQNEQGIELTAIKSAIELALSSPSDEHFKVLNANGTPFPDLIAVPEAHRQWTPGTFGYVVYLIKKDPRWLTPDALLHLNDDTVEYYEACMDYSENVKLVLSNDVATLNRKKVPVPKRGPFLEHYKKKWTLRHFRIMHWQKQSKHFQPTSAVYKHMFDIIDPEFEGYPRLIRDYLVYNLDSQGNEAKDLSTPERRQDIERTLKNLKRSSPPIPALVKGQAFNYEKWNRSAFKNFLTLYGEDYTGFRVGHARHPLVSLSQQLHDFKEADNRGGYNEILATVCRIGKFRYRLIMNQYTIQYLPSLEFMPVDGLSLDTKAKSASLFLYYAWAFGFSSEMLKSASRKILFHALGIIRDRKKHRLLYKQLMVLLARTYRTPEQMLSSVALKKMPVPGRSKKWTHQVIKGLKKTKLPYEAEIPD